MSAAKIAIVEVPRSERGRLLPILEESFEGLYLWHAKRTLESIEVVRVARTPDGEDTGLTMLKTLGEGAGYVYYVAVSVRFRRRGIGGRLLDDAISLLKAKGAREIYASIEDENLESNALFHSREFQSVDSSQMNRRYGRLRALMMYRDMLVVPGETLMSKHIA